VTFDCSARRSTSSPAVRLRHTLPDIGHQDDKGLRRHITVVTSPSEKGVLGLATRMRRKHFKRSLRELPVGTQVEVEQPKGDSRFPTS
jgi:hypothetical protein